ncbi:MAG: DUF3793 family protein [Miniphocaeibacter sp.]|uniref:DUF3793 family protein n=1 Tax=Miniphocaeibacter sp. TaxID=3100973 RepID=UPI003BAEE4C4
MLEKYIINHGSPTLCGEKIANLINVNSSFLSIKEINKLNIMLNKYDMHIYLLKNNKLSTLLYLFNIVKLTKRLNLTSTRKFLSKYSYPLNDTFETLKHLQYRILNNSEFPHEIGIFLDYPLSDVEEYIINKGKNSLLTGTWKVYSNLEYAKKKFLSFQECTNFCKYHYNIGFNLEFILNKYKGVNNEKISSCILDWNR